MSKHATSSDTLTNRNERRTAATSERCHDAFDGANRRPYLTTIDAAAHLNVSKSYLDKARVRGDGPVFIRIGGAVRYAVEDLDAFAASRRVRSTSEAA